ncbi:conserved hypothetical protein [Halanaerobium saccharolyticum subsp. saccharolyticum DSM 6643]|uniref:DUF374 domain-containing protein n=1 Tax=Halanaerobium saccharolyticum subsp. saccharolyticum DSM 6643 TaxID=1293054 RepID=M5EAX0_9FIRM|nr:hypothetical protein [Halanaerobium saccharolyticum]CCU77882.1 conserved hypothetical protein [Halanaerobium saccharolyticum subsp. saccharolyticum DSM 6643]
MEILSQLKEKIISAVLYYYIDFVYKTSKIEKKGNLKYLESDYPDKFVLFIWHGDSYCYYPFLKRKKLNIVTTQNKRGGVITRISNHFGYDVLRLPDTAADGNYMFQLKSQINKTNNANLVLSVDGPEGPEHQIKDFAIIMALFSDRKILPLTVDIKHSVSLKNRWDKLKIPLPFNKITINVKKPFKIERKDRKEKFKSLKKEIKKSMEN